jgi:Integrase core domain
MELVHSDVLGPIRIASIGRAKYVLIFIEHKSRYPKCYYLESKEGSIILEKFEEYKVWVENITGSRIKVLRTDGGGEYVNKAFDEYLKNCGI